MKLNYKASNIAKAERATGAKFFGVVSNLGGDMGISDLMFMFLAGGGSEEEFDVEFAKGFEEVLANIIEGMNEAGFLGEKINTKELRENLRAAKNQAVSANSGKKSKV